MTEHESLGHRAGHEGVQHEGVRQEGLGRRTFLKQMATVAGSAPLAPALIGGAAATLGAGAASAQEAFAGASRDQSRDRKARRLRRRR